MRNDVYELTCVHMYVYATYSRAVYEFDFRY